MTRNTTIWTLAAAAAVGVGCNKEFDGSRLDAQAANNEWMVREYQQDMVYAAIVRQATLYPHHFVAGGARLNELGRRDVEVLSKHLASNPGRLSVRRHDAGEELYAARLQAVRDALEARGVDAARIALEDSFAGGDGVVPERIVRVLAQDTAELRSVESTRASLGGGGSR